MRKRGGSTLRWQRGRKTRSARRREEELLFGGGWGGGGRRRRVVAAAAVPFGCGMLRKKWIGGGQLGEERGPGTRRRLPPSRGRGGGQAPTDYLHAPHSSSRLGTRVVCCTLYLLCYARAFHLLGKYRKHRLLPNCPASPDHRPSQPASQPAPPSIGRKVAWGRAGNR